MPVKPLNSFGAYYLGTLLRPGRTFDALLTDKRRLKFAFWAMLITAALYTLVYVFLTIGGGAPSSFTPWLAIPSEVYYSLDRFFVAPSMCGAWILAAGVAHLLAKLFRGQGTFEDTLSTLAFATAVPTLVSLVHDLPESFLGAIGVIDAPQYEAMMNSATWAAVVLWIFYGLYALLFVVLYPRAAAAAEKLRPGPAILVGLVSLAAYQAVFLTFNR